METREARAPARSAQLVPAIHHGNSSRQSQWRRREADRRRRIVNLPLFAPALHSCVLRLQVLSLSPSSSLFPKN